MQTFLTLFLPRYWYVEALLISFLLRTRFLSLFLSLLWVGTVAYAEPQKPSTATTQCDATSIVEAEYLGYRPQQLLGAIEYFTPPIAQYRVTKHLHGNTTAEYILVRHDFDDGSACIPPKDWAFSSDLMPQQHSKWILFISTLPGTPNWFQTIRGSVGRMPVGAEAESKIEHCR